MSGPADAGPPLHPDIAPLAWLLGEWQGSGHGSYPSIGDFDYVETLVFAHVGRPFVAYVQRSADALDGRRLHAETGYLRPAGPGRAEMVVASPTGIVEVHQGILRATSAGMELELSSRSVGATSTAKEVTAVERSFVLDGGVLRTRLSMAAVGHPLTHHLASALHLVGQGRGEGPAPA